MSKSKATAGGTVLVGLIVGSAFGVLLRRLGDVELSRGAHALGDNSDYANGVRALEGLTKRELYHRAREADIPGRSTMSKSELIAALAGTT
jgi:hypothetical protein